MNSCRSPKNSTEFEKYFDLRYQILRQPWCQPKGSERDELEQQSYHCMVVDDNDGVLAVGRLEQVSEHVGRIRYMAVSESTQGQGLGQQIIISLEQQARLLGLNTIELNARELAVGFYVKLGYQQQGFSYQLFDEIDHYLMTKLL